jgi:hypothetical protein
LKKSLTASLAAALWITAACGSKLSGTYSGNGTGLLDEIAFKSGGKAEVVFLGMRKEGTYEKDGDRVKITINGETNIFAIDGQGCLDAGPIGGKYCKK